MILCLLQLLLPFASAELVISYDVPQKHVEQHPLTYTVLLHNQGTETVEIPDISEATWLMHVDLLGPSGKQTLRSKSPDNPDIPTKVLQPQQIQEIHFQLPNAEALSTGNYQLRLTSTLDKPYTSVHNVEVISNRIHQIDWRSFEGHSSNRVVWSTNQNLFVGLEEPKFITVLPQHKTQFSRTRYQGEHWHLLSIDGPELTSFPFVGNREQDPQNIRLPWEHATFYRSAASDFSGTLYIPFWVPNPNSETGTLYVCIQDISTPQQFRKIYSGTRPSHLQMDITQSDVPMLLLGLETEVLLFVLEQVGNPQIDRLPPKARKISLGEPIIQMNFRSNPGSGQEIQIDVLNQNHQYMQTFWSLQGQEYKDRKNEIIPESMNPTFTVVSQSSESIWYTQEQQTKAVLFTLYKRDGVLSSTTLPILLTPENHRWVQEGSTLQLWYIHQERLSHHDWVIPDTSLVAPTKSETK